LAEQIVSGKLLINNEWVNALSGKTFTVINPATEAVIGEVAEAATGDVDNAVRVARRAFGQGAWPKLSARDRGKLLYKLADLVEKNSADLAELETRNNGKPIRETAGVDLPFVVDTFRYYAGLADKIHGETIPVNGAFLNYTLREPMGVVGQIIPWNFPLLMAAWKLGPALATGCTVILKPAEQTPLTALRLGQLIVEAGFPPGVVNILPGFAEAGAAIARHMDVDKVAFTGSTEVGKLVMQAASETNLKRVSLELGGKAPNIVFADADLDAAVQGAIDGIFFNQGEVCCAGSRLLVEEKIHGVFLDKLKSRAESIRVGNPLDSSTEMGAQVSREQFERILSYIEVGKAEGCSLVTGGGPAADRGFFIKPTVFDSKSADSRIYREEIFGPVVAATSFRSMDDLIPRADHPLYGLSAGIWTRDLQKAHQVARALKAGTVWINCFNRFDAASPFGGYKQSGFGRELGHHAVELYTQVKSVWVSLQSN
jgi:aldehyde dehydrogenase (NAD+)